MQFIRTSLFVLLALGPAAGATTLSAREVGSNLDLMNRFTVTIDAKAEKVWPLLFQGEKWGWFAKVENVKLSGDRVGGVVALYTDAKAKAPRCLIRTVVIELHKQYGFSIYCSDDRFNGFGSFELEESGGVTRVVYDLYLHNLNLPPAGASEEQVALQAAEESRKLHQEKARQLATLKKVAEQRE